MMQLFLLPGGLLCNAFGLNGDSDHRQMLRSFLNILILGAISIAVAFQIAL